MVHFRITTSCLICAVPDVAPLGICTETRGSFSSHHRLTDHSMLERTIMSHGLRPCQHLRRDVVPISAQLTRTVPESVPSLALKGGTLERQLSASSDRRFEKLFVCMRAQMSLDAHMYAYGGLKLMLSVFPDCSILLVEAGSLAEPRACQFWLITQSALGLPSGCPSTGTRGALSCLPSFYVGSGMWNPVLFLTRQMFDALSHDLSS